jgi:hypothetical protein
LSVSVETQLDRPIAASLRQSDGGVIACGIPAVVRRPVRRAAAFTVNDLVHHRALKDGLRLDLAHEQRQEEKANLGRFGVWPSHYIIIGGKD